MPKSHQPHHSLKGQLLLDGGKLRGSSFHRTVVLVCEHKPDGAFGLVLNRPSDNKLGDVIESVMPEILRETTLFGGGPVQPAALSYLHTDADQAAANVMESLAVGHDLDELLELGNSWRPSRRLRVFAGYAGWSAGQLDEEFRRDSWLTQTATLDLVFHTPPAELWSHILRLRGDWQSRLLAASPEDLAWN